MPLHLDSTEASATSFGDPDWHLARLMARPPQSH